MSEEEFATEMARLVELADKSDPEIAHSNADKLMCSILRELGYSKGVELFEEMEKWYG